MVNALWRTLSCVLLLLSYRTVALCQTASKSVFTATSFDNRIDLPGAHGGAFSVAVSDFDGDGLPDIAAPSYNYDSIVVYRNASTKGSVSFPAQSWFGNAPGYAIGAGDIDGDGKTDLVLTNNGINSITIFRNTSVPGSISFVLAATFIDQWNNHDISIADVDGDGKLDILTASMSENLVTIHINRSSPGHFDMLPSVSLATPNGAYALAVSDIDGDGKPDLAVSSIQSSTFSQDSILLFRNTGTPGNISFQGMPGIGKGILATDLLLTDLDGDGKTELIATEGKDSSIAVWHNLSTPGSLNFGDRQVLTTRYYPSVLSVADFDQDGNPDIAVACRTGKGNFICLFQNKTDNGNLAFASRTEYTAYTDPYGMTTADLDGDGKPDIITGNMADKITSVLRNRYQEPTLFSFSPLAVFPGATVTIKGVNLLTTKSVSFGGIAAASFTVLSDSVVTAVVAGGASGTVLLTTNFGYSSLIGFEIRTALPPAIASFSPLSGPVGTVVTITGTNFDTAIAGNSVWFGAVKATVTAASATSLKVKVPLGATYEPLSVMTHQLTVYARTPFTTTFSGAVNPFTAASFAQPLLYKNTKYASDVRTDNLTVADFDGDGRPDVLILGSMSEAGFTIWSNTGLSDTALFTWNDPIDWLINPGDVSIGDLDGDGKPDIALAGSSNYGLIILHNTSVPGKMSFANIAHIPGNSIQYRKTVILKDMDMDGKLDIVTLYNDRTLIYRNTTVNGTLSFADSLGFAGGKGIAAIAISDLDGDGKPDLITLNASDNNFSVLRNTSSPSAIAFAAKSDLAAGSNPAALTVADFDDDGKPDIAVSDEGLDPAYANTIYLFRNTSGSSLSLTSAGTLTAVPRLGQITAGDLDGDGKPDLLVVCPQADSLALFRNKSSGTSFAFANPVYYQTGYWPIGARIADLDGDAQPDIEYWTTDGSGFAMMRSTIDVTAETFIPPVITAFSPGSAAAGTSLTITGLHFSTTPSKNIVYIGTVSATVTKASATSLTVTVPQSAGYASLTVTRDRLTAMSSQRFVQTFPHTGASLGDQFLGTRKDTAIGKEAARIALADMNGDGLQDLLVANATAASLAVYPNTGKAGTYPFDAPYVYNNANTFYWSVTTMDVNGDGKLDIVAVDFGVSVFINTSIDGNLSFAAPVNLGAGWVSKVEKGDFDGDGRLDLAAWTGSQQVAILRNITANNVVAFEWQTGFYASDAIGGIASGDMNGDGYPDMVVTHGDRAAAVYLNIPNGSKISFATPLNYTTGSYPGDVVTADLDGDGRLDFAVADRFDTIISVFRAQSSTGYAGSSYRVASGPSGLAAGDLNGDGLPDLVIGNSNTDSVFLWKNTSSSGTISFAPGAGYASPSASQQPLIGDWTADGLPDIMLSMDQSSVVSLYPNQMQRPVISSFTPTVLSPGTLVTINGYNLSSAKNVSLGGQPVSSFRVISDNQITAVAGEGMEGYLSVTTGSGSDSLTGLYFAPPVITDCSPRSGPVGTKITITGDRFSTVPAHNTVFFGAVKGTVTAAGTTSLTVEVPAGADLRPITVTTFGETGTASHGFDVKFANLGNGFTKQDFDSVITVAAGNSPKAIAAADLDGDGSIDIVAGNMILRNLSGPGLIRFAAPIAYGIPPGYAPTAVTLEDINGDGRPDIIEMGYRNGVFLNTSTTGQLSFAPEYFFNEGSTPGKIAVADLDGDGKRDIILSADYGNYPVSVLRNTSLGNILSFKSDNASVYIGQYGSILSVQDMDGDGKPDVVGLNSDHATVAVFQNNSVPGAISFPASPTAWLTASGNPTLLRLADLDGDGKPDIAVLNTWNFSSPISVFKNTCTPGHFSFVQQTGAGVSTMPSEDILEVSDWDGDGKPDLGFMDLPELFLARNTSSATVLTFDASVQYDVISSEAGMLAADLDGDGKPEVVTGIDQQVNILRNRQAEARVRPDGANPVSGPVVNQVTVDSTVQSLNGAPYVPRHYDIQPQQNAATATANLTLYFTQQDFDAFNAVSSHGPDLPHNPDDLQGIADLRIYQYHGLSATSEPGSYTGDGLEIDPADSNIRWNAQTRVWEVSFEVNGFSGFFASSKGFSYNQIPAPRITADGPLRVCQGDSLKLSSSALQGNQWYKDGTAIPDATGNSYDVTQSGVYTVKTTNNAIESPLSAAITVQQDTPPAKPVITRNGMTLESSAPTGNQWYWEGAAIAGATDRQYQAKVSGDYTVSVQTGTCPARASDVFALTIGGIIRIDSIHFITLGPNPFKDALTIRYSIAGNRPLQIRVIDMMGHTCYTSGPLNSGATLDLSRLTSGIYIVQLFSDEPARQYVIKVKKGY